MISTHESTDADADADADAIIRAGGNPGTSPNGSHGIACPCGGVPAGFDPPRHLVDSETGCVVIGTDGLPIAEYVQCGRCRRVRLIVGR